MRLDSLQVFDAAEALGLKIPVHVQFRKGKHFAGRYVGIQDHPHSGCAPFPGGQKHHVILVNPRSSNASRTLWHELTHALQCERDFNSDFYELNKKHSADAKSARASSSIKSGKSTERYRNTPLEKEANENGEKMHEKMPFKFTEV